MRIMIVGYSGAGKSTLARTLGERLTIPVLHRDRVYWAPGWRKRADNEVHDAIYTFLNVHDSWVIDGTYSRFCFDERLALADQIIVLALPRMTCFVRAWRRYWRSRGSSRADMGAGCDEKFDITFARWLLWDGRTRERCARLIGIQQQFPRKSVAFSTTD